MASQTMRIITRFVSFLKASATGNPSSILVSKEPATQEITTLSRDDRGEDLDTSNPNSDLILAVVIRK